jgi:CubicO group peptidase (beta-lactamase class C family)
VIKPAVALFLLLCVLSSASPVLAQQATIRKVIRTHAPRLSGTVLIAKNGKTIYRESFGLANRQFEVPNTIDTKYRIASITKLFTSTVALQLHDEGKLALDHPIVTYLPTCSGPLGSHVTVHQLLTHTSGMSDLAAVASKEEAIRIGIDVYQHPYTSEALAARYCSAPVVSAPGEAFQYNNGDYIVLGRIIEAIEGQPFEAVLQRRILGPLGMQNSGMLYQHRIVPRLASGYFTRDEAVPGLSNDMPVYDENWYAAGAMYSTAADLLKFAEALFGGRLLKESTFALLIKPGLDGYGYGLWIYHDKIGGKDFTAAMRPGQIMGTNTVLYRVLEAGLTIVVLSNTDESNVDALANQLSLALLP